MKKTCALFVILFLLAGVTGCTTASVSSDYDRATDFATLKTYGWASDQPLAGDRRFDDPDLRETIRRSVETELQAKGIQKSEDGHPDLLLKYYITVEKKKQFVGGNYPPTFNSRGVWTGTSGPNTYAGMDSMTFHYEDGTFVLDMLDPRSGAILWRGTLQGMVDPGATPAKRIERAPSAVAKVLKDFPPMGAVRK